MKTWHYSCLHPWLGSAARSGGGLQPHWGGPAGGSLQLSREPQQPRGSWKELCFQKMTRDAHCLSSKVQSVCQEDTGPMVEPRDSFPHVGTSCNLVLSNVCTQHNWLIVTKPMYFCIHVPPSSIRKNVSNGTGTPG